MSLDFPLTIVYPTWNWCDHKISSRGIEVDKAKIDIIEKLPPLMNVKGIQSFLIHARLLSEVHKRFLQNC